ncbi:hypothetical protein QO010_004764 [Caulobacter ginsengisoli]|uniref:Lipoprotein n=1 Tax=Caulobacter ginsengisoli TaxID=400775 RepID=A0ABU0J170_9CAUL|nr:hypothetical protein [Caulobacter ginsengisoli]MDQ0466967.1 hypothetical protein [Caulobacter ginsengisoli]
MPGLALAGRAMVACLALMMAACSPALSAAGDPSAAESAESGPVRLGAEPARIALTPPPGLRAAAARGASLILVLDRLSADRQPGVLYRVEIEGAAQPLGHLNLYNAVTGGPAEFRFPLPANSFPGGALPPPGKPLIVIVTPESAPDPDARVLLGRVTLSSQP